MHALPLVALGLLALASVTLVFALVMPGLAVLLGVGVKEVGLGWIRVWTVQLRGVRVRVGLLPLGSYVSFLRPGAARAGAPEEPEDEPYMPPAWLLLLLLAGAAAGQLALCALVLGAPAVGSFARGLVQALRPLDERVGPWVLGLSARAAQGITAGLVAAVAVKLAAANLTVQAASTLARPVARLLRREPRAFSTAILLAGAALGVTWLIRIGAALRG